MYALTKALARVADEELPGEQWIGSDKDARIG